MTAPHKHEFSSEPSEVLRYFLVWLRGFHRHREKSKSKKPPRELSKTADWWLVGLTGAGLVAAIASAIFIYEQLRDAQHNFRVDERAWIALEPVAPPTIESIDKIVGDDLRLLPLQLRDSERFSTNVNLQNVGKTIATRVKLDVGLFCRGLSFDMGNAAITSIQDELAKGLLPPMWCPDKNGEIYSPKNPTPIANIDETVMAPNSRMSTRVVHVASKKAQLLDYSHHALFLIGNVNYCDEFEIHHWFRFCYSIIGRDQEPLRMCAYGNNADNEPEVNSQEKNDQYCANRSQTVPDGTPHDIQKDEPRSRF